MKNFAGASFFRTFDLLMSVTNPGAKLSQWVVAGVACRRERHSFAGAGYGFAVEVFQLTRCGRRSWALLVVREFWWGAQAGEPLKRLHWARPIGGRRVDILAWFLEQEGKLDRAARGAAPAVTVE
jgi:hypothetical protein